MVILVQGGFKAVSMQIQPIEYFILFTHGVQSLGEFCGVHNWLIIPEYDNQAIIAHLTDMVPCLRF